MLTKGDVATALWTTLVHCYNQGGRTKVEIPTEEVVTVLCALLANVISQVPTSERAAYLTRIAPLVSRMLASAEDRPHLHIASRGMGLILP